MLRLSTLASSEDLLEERSHKAVDDVGVVVDLGIMLDVEFWKGSPPDAVCCNRRIADKSKSKK